MFVAPVNVQAQALNKESLEILGTEVLDADSLMEHPKYDSQMKPYVAETYRDLPVMSAAEATINPHKTYVGYFDNHGELQVIRTDCRYSAATPDMLAGVRRAECTNYNTKYLQKRHIADRVPRGFTLDEAYDYFKSPNNSLGEMTYDYCNFRKKYIGSGANKRSIVVRAGFFQGGVNEWTACLRAAYCSSDEYVRKFASNFIVDTKENLAVRDSVMKVIYDKDGEFISGEEGVKKRIRISPLLNKITIESIGGRVGGYKCLNDKLCNLLLHYTKKQKFKNENEEFEYNKMANGLKKLEEDYTIAWYPLAGKTTKISKNADIYVANETNKKVKPNKPKVTSEQVKAKGGGIYTPPGVLLAFLESSVNGGPYFDGYAKGSTSNGYYPLTYKVLKNFMAPFNKNKLLTQEFLRQAALLGISGAKAAYEAFNTKLNKLQKEEQEIIDRLQKNKFKPVAPQDAVRQNRPFPTNVQPRRFSPQKQPNQAEK